MSDEVMAVCDQCVITENAQLVFEAGQRPAVVKQTFATLDERSAFIMSFRGLVHKVAKRLWDQRPLVRRLGEFTDVFQVGCRGLIQAADCYDPHHHSSAKFTTYACKAIHCTILREAQALNLIHVPRNPGRYQEEAERALVWDELPSGYDLPEQYHDEAAPDRDQLNHLLHLLPTAAQWLLRHHFGLAGLEPMTEKQLATATGWRLGQVKARLEWSLKELRDLMATEGLVEADLLEA